MTTESDSLDLRIIAVEPHDPLEGQPGIPMTLHTTRGQIHASYHQAPEPKAGVVWVWGARGGIEGPADGIYGVLAEELMSNGITSLRVDYRKPNDLTESILDTLAGVSLLSGFGYSSIALVGHSFGGAVVISAAPFSKDVKAVAALSSQTYGAQKVSQVSPRPLLLVHGEEDTRLSPRCSKDIFAWAQEPKELVLYPGANHSLRECKQQLHSLLQSWLVQQLTTP